MTVSNRKQWYKTKPHCQKTYQVKCEFPTRTIKSGVSFLLVLSSQVWVSYSYYEVRCEFPTRTIKSGVSFLLVLQNHPIIMLYYYNMMFWLDVFLVQKYKTHTWKINDHKPCSTYIRTFRREHFSPNFEGPFRQLSKSSVCEKNQVQ